jgi:glutamyl-tRNA reductase
MPLLVVGINHRTAPLEIRERVVFEPARIATALADLRRDGGTDESLIVSTCNRTELYCVTDAPDRLSSWLESYHGHAVSLAQSIYELTDDAAVEHAFAVASGLDSLVIGEPQILGQLKDAYRAAQEAGTVGPELNRLLQATFSVAKRVRTETRIGANAVSVAYAAVSLARQIFAGFENRTALLIGAGETIALAARHLRGQGISRMIIANRSLERAQALASEFKASAIGLEALPAFLPQADIVVSSTASPEPVLLKSHVGAALNARRRKPMFMVDIAVPRDIEASVADFEDVYLYTIDDLQTVVDGNLAAREQEAREARSLIREEVASYMAAQRGREAVPTIRAMRDAAETLRAQTLDQARRMLHAGRAPEDVLAYLADTLTHRLIHAPTHTLREAGRAGDAALVAAARQIFQIDEEP